MGGDALMQHREAIEIKVICPEVEKLIIVIQAVEISIIKL